MEKIRKLSRKYLHTDLSNVFWLFLVWAVMAITFYVYRDVPDNIPANMIILFQGLVTFVGFGAVLDGYQDEVTHKTFPWWFMSWFSVALFLSLITVFGTVILIVKIIEGKSIPNPFRFINNKINGE